MFFENLDVDRVIIHEVYRRLDDKKPSLLPTVRKFSLLVQRRCHFSAKGSSRLWAAQFAKHADGNFSPAAGMCCRDCEGFACFQ